MIARFPPDVQRPEMNLRAMKDHHQKAMNPDSLRLLQLMHLSDSALPIGTASHSFGLETLVEEKSLTVEGLYRFLSQYLEEVGVLEGAYCRAAFRLSRSPHSQEWVEEWLGLNRKLSALKPARESRAASATLGRRFLQLVLGLEEHPLLLNAFYSAKDAKEAIHHPLAFGLSGGALHLEEEAVVAAYLQSSMTALISAGQRLMPLGQSEGGRLLWRLKPAIQAAAERGREADIDDLSCFSFLLEVGSMRHPALTTRLFIS